MKWMLNNQIIDENSIHIPVKDHGFLYGVGLFETFRVYNGVPFLFAEHLDRLALGLRMLMINYEVNKETLLKELEDLLSVNELKDAYVRLTITGGVAPFELPSVEYSKPNVLWQIKKLPESLNQIKKKSAVILKTRRNTPETKVRFKSINFLNNIIAKLEISHLENTEGIFLNSEGYVAEGIVSNIFFIKDEIIYTPDVETGILNGITRQHVMQICETNNLKVKEGYFLPGLLLTADEVFITNSIQGIVPIKKIDDIIFNKTTLTLKLIKFYQESVATAVAVMKGSDKHEN